MRVSPFFITLLVFASGLFPGPSDLKADVLPAGELIGTANDVSETEAYLCLEIKLFGGKLVLNPDGTVNFRFNGENIGSYGTTWEMWNEEGTRGVEITFPGFYFPFLANFPAITLNLIANGYQVIYDIEFSHEGSEWLIRGDSPSKLNIYKDGNLVRNPTGIPTSVLELLSLLEKYSGLRVSLPTC